MFFPTVKACKQLRSYKKVVLGSINVRELRVPEERIGVLIGQGGETKNDLEEFTDCEVTINDNNVRIEGEALDEMIAENVVRAIGRGFNPEKAFKLIEEGYEFHQLDINRFADTRKSQERLKGRVIGKDGEARKHIEKMTETDISVYGKTVGFVGHIQNIEIAQEAVKMLLNGSSHATAYDYLERNQNKVKK